MAPKTRILVVDDSVVARKIISDILNEEESFEVVGTAANGRIALAKVPILSPDVVTLDVDMPEMGGLEMLAALRSEYPDTKVVMVSNLTKRGAQTTVDALFLGASDYVTKATMSESPEQAKRFMQEQLVPKIHALADPRHAPRIRRHTAKPQVIPAAKTQSTGKIQLLAIGASTGGPNALSTVLQSLPRNFPVPILIVQHMPPDFTAYLAKRLNEQCRVTVAEPSGLTRLEPGHAWIAPGNSHIEVRGSAKAAEVRIKDGPLVNSCRPSVDVLFNSVAKTIGGDVLAVILTGMGQDGLRGCEALNEAGAQIIAQDEATSVVWGMPGYVAGAGLADAVLPIEEIGPEILSRVGKSRR